nr:DUF3152 domain-containing protein [Streptomyces misionensis]
MAARSERGAERAAPGTGAGARAGVRGAQGPAGPGRGPDPTPAHGVPRLPEGTPARGVPRSPEGAAARGVPRLPDGAPAHGVPGVPDAGAARGGHPEQREPGGGWGDFAGRTGTGAHGVVLPRQRQAGPGGPAGRGPRQDYLDAFDGDGDGGGDRGRGGPGGTRTQEEPAGHRETAAPGAVEEQKEKAAPAQRGGKGRAFTGIAAAAVTTVLAVVVAGQVTEGRDDAAAPGRSAPEQGDASGRPSAPANATPLTYEQKMDRTYPLSATLKGAGKFDTVPGFDKAPGAGQKYRYRVDIEQGMGLDGALFAQAVQKTLNDDRSWAHGGARTFERISSGKPDFVITLASPGTTATWCAKSGLDTTEDNVSCDSAATQRVMINAYRWAQGSKTYGDKIHMYRQMLINHEVGHRLGHNHVTCEKNGELAPVMQQQTKFLDHDGIHCLPNAWPYPRS